MNDARNQYAISRQLGVDAAGGASSMPDFSSAADAELKRRGLK